MNTDALLHWLLRTSIEASVLILAVLGLRLMLGARLSPAWRIGLWMLVGIKLMLPAFIPAGFGLGSWMQKENDSVIAQSAAATVAFEVSEYSVSSAGQSASVATHIPATPHIALQLPHFLLALWLTGAFAVLVMAFIRQHRFDSFLRRRPRSNDPLLTSHLSRLTSLLRIPSPPIILMPAGTTPAMVGVRQPKLLLPEDWQTRFDDHSLRHVLLHELLHVKQRDLLWNWAAIAVQALHWFNPLVWFVVSRFQSDRELRCDAGALALLSPTERLDYGHTLLRIQETFFAPPAIAGLAPCVRNHPTLRQRILMITHPTTRQPWLHALLVLTLSVLVCYSFTTARAQEKEVPAKVREGETVKKPASDADTPVRKGEGESGMKKTSDGERDGGTKKPGSRDGEGGVKKPGSGDGEGGKKPSGARDGEGGVKKPDMRDGEGGAKKPGARDGDKTTSSGEVITLKVIKNGDAVMIGDEEISMDRLRGHLSTFLPDHPGAKVIVTGDDNIPLGALHNTVDAVRDNGNKNVGIKAE